MPYVFDILLIVFLISAALAVAHVKDLLAATLIFASYSLGLSLLFLHLDAPDVAMTEAAVGAGITTVLFLIAIGKTARRER